VELLVVITIIGILMGLLLPAVQSARERARQATCTTNLGELGKAMVSYATSGKGVFPGYLQQQLLVDQSNLDISWAAKLLPHIDLQSDWTELLAGNLTVPGSRIPRRDIFICPSSPPTIKDWGALTYVANTGAPDIEPGTAPNYPQSDFSANGICHNLISTPDMNGPRVRFGADLQDGAAKTLLLSENVHKDEPGSSSINNSWLRSSAFFQGQNGGFGEQFFGMVWVYEGPGNFNNPSSQMRINRRPDSLLNQPFTSFGPAYARPASEHPEIVSAVFAGGNVQSISDQIEYRVYQQLMTPNGRNARYPGLDGNATTIMRNKFNNPMLSDSDY
jgi:type II secretory pathway pseudopilin PulG